MNSLIKLYRKNWWHGSTIHCIGWCYRNGTCYSGQAFLQLLESLVGTATSGLEEIRKLAEVLTGHYAILLIGPKHIYLLADRVRSFPLVYGYINDTFFVTDDLLRIKKEYTLDLSVNIRQAELFIVSGMVFEEQTIFQDVYGLQAAEIVQLAWADRTISRERYFLYTLNTGNRPLLSVKEEVPKQNKIFSDVFQRMLKSAPNVRNWVIPLSGGHDSRMVIYQLYKLGVRNVVCYSYGTKDSMQATISKQVASAFGYKWHFVEYTPEKWHEIRQNPLFDQYFDFAFNGISNPHIQDLLAVYELNRQGIIAHGDCFVPGHTFDFITGSQCLKGIQCIKTEKQAAYYLRYFMNQWICQQRSPSVQQILTGMMRHYPISLNHFTELFLWQEWHCKFLLNSVRVYEFFGYDWRAPLWDQALVEYWQSIHVEDKLYRNFLYQCEQAGLYEEPLSSIPFDFHMKAPNPLKKAIHDLVPYTLIRKYKHYYTCLRAEYADNDLYTIYAHAKPTLIDLIPYNTYPEELRYYLKPYLNYPVYRFPDNDVNSLYALREQFKARQP